MKNKSVIKKENRVCPICVTIKEMTIHQRFCSRKCRKKATQIDSFDNEYKFHHPNRK